MGYLMIYSCQIMVTFKACEADNSYSSFLQVVTLLAILFSVGQLSAVIGDAYA